MRKRQSTGAKAGALSNRPPVREASWTAPVFWRFWTVSPGRGLNNYPRGPDLKSMGLAELVPPKIMTPTHVSMIHTTILLDTRWIPVTRIGTIAGSSKSAREALCPASCGMKANPIWTGRQCRGQNDESLRASSEHILRGVRALSPRAIFVRGASDWHTHC
jgi:hypothetical protein